MPKGLNHRGCVLLRSDVDSDIYAPKWPFFMREKVQPQQLTSKAMASDGRAVWYSEYFCFLCQSQPALIKVLVLRIRVGPVRCMEKALQGTYIVYAANPLRV